jgi:hypothetical protein
MARMNTDMKFPKPVANACVESGLIRDIRGKAQGFGGLLT